MQKHTVPTAKAYCTMSKKKIARAETAATVPLQEHYINWLIKSQQKNKKFNKYVDI